MMIVKDRSLYIDSEIDYIKSCLNSSPKYVDFRMVDVGISDIFQSVLESKMEVQYD